MKIKLLVNIYVYTYVIILFLLHNNIKNLKGNLTICRTIFPNQYVVNDGKETMQIEILFFSFSRLLSQIN